VVVVVVLVLLDLFADFVHIEGLELTDEIDEDVFRECTRL
jgi:hypothetical protein